VRCAESCTGTSKRRHVTGVRYTEVGQLCDAFGRDQHVVRLDVSVNDAGVMRCVEAGGHIRAYFRHAIRDS
jgi:hypothetical protein